jgi:hypothetical protein
MDTISTYFYKSICKILDCKSKMASLATDYVNPALVGVVACIITAGISNKTPSQVHPNDIRKMHNQYGPPAFF